MKMKILIADDDPDMRKIVKLYFEKSGFYVDIAADGQAAVDKLCKETYDLAVLDWMMPGLSGLLVIKEIKELKIAVKTILLTAKTTNEDELKGLQYGADDYIRKPFEPQILLIRAKRLLHMEGNINCGSISYSELEQKIKKEGKELVLSKKEFELLLFFLKNQGIVLSREVLLERVWGYDYDGDGRTVDTHIKRLRSKIGDTLISTHRGLGYCMEKNP